jgi:threonine aldolase
MRAAMCAAPVGDDVMIEDPTVNALEGRVAAMAGKEAALFVATGVMSNQICIKTHLVHNPGSPTVFQAVLCDARAHVNVWENGGIGHNAGGQVRAVVPANGRYLTAEDVEANLQLNFDWHQPVTTLVCLEVPIDGVVTPLAEIARIRAVVDRHAPFMRLHLDGARAWNAIVALGCTLEELCAPFDSVSLCGSKGLGAPVGSVLVGRADFVRRGREIRKSLGGGWRQAGMLAAGVAHALDEHLPLLAGTHALAARLAAGLTALGVEVTAPVETNMVWARATREACGFGSWDAIAARLEAENAGSSPIRIGQGSGGGKIRFVLHFQCSEQGVDRIIAECAAESKAQGKKAGAE